VLAAESRNMHTFNVEKEATKAQIVASIKAAYKVTPEKIRLVAVPSKRVFVRGAWGVKKGGKKAYVYLKKGDKIAE
jgi:ribosomal protein L23